MELRVRVLLGPGPHSLLPTKNSRFCIHSFGSSHVFFRSASQVDLTFRFEVLSRFILVAMILSSVSRLFMFVTHLFFISLMVWFFCWITRSHRRTHTRWADSVMRICRSLTAPDSERRLWFSSFSSLFGSARSVPRTAQMGHLTKYLTLRMSSCRHTTAITLLQIQ